MNLHDEEEIAALSRWILETPDEPQAILLSGAPGSGRRYLLGCAVEQARGGGLSVLHATLDLDGWEPDRVSGAASLAYLASKTGGEALAGASAEEPANLDQALRLAAAAGADEGSERFVKAETLRDLADGLGAEERLVLHVVDSASLPALARKRLFKLGDRPGVRFALSCDPRDGTNKVARGAAAMRFELMPLDEGEIRVLFDVDEETADSLRKHSGGFHGALAERLDAEAPRTLLEQALEAAPEEKRRHLESFAHLASLCGENVPVRRLLAFLGIDADGFEDWIDLIDETLGVDSDLALFAERFEHPAFADEQVYGFRSSADAATLRAGLPPDSRARLAAELLGSFSRSMALDTRAATRLFVELCGHAQADHDRKELERELAWWVGPGDADALREQLAQEVTEGLRTFALLWTTVNTVQFRWPAYRTLAVLDAAVAQGAPQPLEAAVEAIRSGLMLEVGRFADAEATAKKGIELSTDKLLESALSERLGAALRSQGREDDAAEAFARSHELRMELLEEGDRRVAPVLKQYAQMLRRESREDEAAKIEERLASAAETQQAPPARQAPAAQSSS